MNSSLDSTQPLPQLQRLRGVYVSARALMNAVEISHDIELARRLRRMSAPPTPRQLALSAWTHLNFIHTRRASR